MSNRRKRPVLSAWKKAVRGLYDAIATTAMGMWPGGGYAVLDPRRKMAQLPLYLRSESANELASMSLPQLRALCRKLDRDNATARGIVEGSTAEIVGTGIYLEPDTGDPKTDARIRVVWQEYLATCDISGCRSIYDLQGMALRENVLAGEHLWRLVTLQERADKGMIPVCILPLESEWLVNEPLPAAGDKITAVNGIELDRWGRPVAYQLCNPADSLTAKPERVQAFEIIHGFEHRRALQARGEPWMAPCIERLWQESDLVSIELRAATNCAAPAIVVKSANHDDLDTSLYGTSEDPAAKIAAGATTRLFPGDEAEAFSHNRPSQQIAPFRGMMRGDTSAGMRISRRWLDRDYSVANRNSMQADSQDSERLLAPVRQWFGHATIGALYLRVLPWLALKAGVPVPKRTAYRLIPDGTPIVDPLKENEASSTAILSGLSNHEKELGKRGEDYREVWKQLAKEKAEAKALGLEFNMTGADPMPPETPANQPNQPKENADD